MRTPFLPIPAILATACILLLTACPVKKDPPPNSDTGQCKDSYTKSFGNTLSNWTDPTSYQEDSIQHFRYSQYYPYVCITKPVKFRVNTTLSTETSRPIQVTAFIEYGDNTDLRLNLNLNSIATGKTHTMSGEYEVILKDYLPLNDYTHIRVSVDYEFKSLMYYYTDLDFFKRFFQQLSMSTDYYQW